MRRKSWERPRWLRNLSQKKGSAISFNGYRDVVSDQVPATISINASYVIQLLTERFRAQPDLPSQEEYDKPRTQEENEKEKDHLIRGPEGKERMVFEGSS